MRRRLLGRSLVLLATLRGMQAQQLTKPEAELVKVAIAALASTDEAARDAAIDRLAELAARARRQIEALFAHPDADVRLSALFVYRRAPEAADASLVPSLFRDADARVRETAVILYTQLRPEGWAPSLAAELAREGNPRVLRQLVVALGDSEDIRVVPRLIDALEFVKEESLKGKIAQSLLSLSGEGFGANAAAWREWWAAADRVKQVQDACKRAGAHDPTKLETK